MRSLRGCRASFRRRFAGPAVAGAWLLTGVVGCATPSQRVMAFMPPPVVTGRDTVLPLAPAENDASANPLVLYATVRAPLAQLDSGVYSDARGTAVIVGAAEVAPVAPGITWQGLADLSALRTAATRPTIRLKATVPFGPLQLSDRLFLDGDAEAPPDTAARARFRHVLAAQLTRRGTRDVTVYVHGYRAAFDGPVLLSAELWHYSNYDGVVIPFTWPSHLGRLDYFGDTETARYAAPFLRDFLGFLATDTVVRRIHVLGYSAGTRMVAAALHQLALQHRGLRPEEIRRRTKLGHVLLVSSDVDRGIFGGYLSDGLLAVQEHLTLYESPRDRVLGMASFAFGQRRLGQLDIEALSPAARRVLAQGDRLTLISVGRALGADRGTGHAYFRESPWVSADLLSTLRYGLTPAERGLSLRPDGPVWYFPADYAERLARRVRQGGGPGGQ